jgi:peroxiredoxin Q/BCP
LAVSTDKEATQASFRREIGAPFAFVADNKGELTRNYGVKTPLITFAKRYTFVIGKERKVLHVDSGGDALDPEGAMQACSLY